MVHFDKCIDKLRSRVPKNSCGLVISSACPEVSLEFLKFSRFLAQYEFALIEWNMTMAGKTHERKKSRNKAAPDHFKLKFIIRSPFRRKPMQENDDRIFFMPDIFTGVYIRRGEYPFPG
jgi:hypothetical protein